MLSYSGVPLWRAAILATILCAGVAVQPASASLITETFNFSAFGFVPFIVGGGGTAPVDPVTGSFTVTFDPTVDVPTTATGITLNNINISLNPASVEFFYNASVQQILIGNDPPSFSVFPGQDQFFATFLSAGGNAPSLFQVAYSQSGFPIFVTDSGTITVASVPEPSSLLLFAVGLAGLGIARRRRSA